MKTTLDCWVIQGVGLEEKQIFPFLNKEKCYDLIKALFPKELKAWGDSKEDFDLDQFLYATDDKTGVHDICELLTRLDTSGVMKNKDDGHGRNYFYYEPSLPWNRRPNEPETLQDVRKIILDNLLKICEISEKEAGSIINDTLYVTGYVG